MLRIKDEEYLAALALAERSFGPLDGRNVTGYEDAGFRRCILKFSDGKLLEATFDELEEAALKIREEALAIVEEIFGFRPTDIVQTECIFPPTRKRERQRKFLWRHSVFIP